MADTNQTLAAVSGTDGRVKLHAGSPTRLNGITKWRRQSKVTVMHYPSFESGSDAATSTVQANILKGLGESTVSIEGWYNTNSTDQTEIGTSGLTAGAVVALDLMISKTLSTGYSNVVGIVSSFETGQEVENKISMFTMEVTVNGPFPPYGAVS